MLISKKELLKETGISYGQLYRWKRERLIPEEWFIKQSTYTGQETYFPKEQILDRIRKVQELKDKYSLEELAKILSPEVVKQGFPMDELAEIEEIDKELLDSFQTILNRSNFDYIEVLIFIILCNLKKEFDFSVEQTSNLLIGMNDSLTKMKSTDYIIVVLTKDYEYFSIIYQEQSPIYIDNRFHVIKTIRMDDISNQMKIKYRNYFDFYSDNLKSNQQNSSNYNTSKDNQKYEYSENKDYIDIEIKDNQNDNQDINQDKKEYQDDYQRNNKTSDQDTKNNNHKSDEIVFKINNWEVRL
jgi:hypothetical protein